MSRTHLPSINWAAYEWARVLFNETWARGRRPLYAGVVVESDKMPQPGSWSVVHFPRSWLDPAESFGLPLFRVRVPAGALDDMYVEEFRARYCELDAHELGYGLDA